MENFVENQEYQKENYSELMNIKEDIVKIKEEVESLHKNIKQDKENSESICNSLLSLKEEVDTEHSNLVEEYENLKTEYRNFLKDLTEKKEKIDNVFKKIVDVETGSPEFDEEDFVSVIDDIERKYKKIKEYADELLGKERIVEEEINSSVFSLLDDSERKTKNNRFYRIINEHVPGIRDDFKRTSEEFNKYIDSAKQMNEEINKNNELAFKEMLSKVESLLPNATAAGLSEAYAKACADAELKIEKWSLWYSGSLFLILIVSIFLSAKNIIVLSEIDSLTKIFIQLMKMIGVEFPIIWFATTANNKVIQYTRLAEEYRHKWSVMRVFDGMKKAIENEESSENISTHMDTFYGSVLKLLSLNPTNNFDKKITSDSPVEKFLDKLKNTKHDPKDEEQINKKDIV